MSNKENTVAKKAQFPLWPDMSEAEKLQLVQEGYEHGLYALTAYGKGYVKGKTPSDKILGKAGFPPELIKDFAETHTIIDQYDSWTGMSAVVIRNDITGNVALSARGTQPTSVRDLLTDALIALGVPKELNPQYRALKSKVEEWIEDGTLPSQFTIGAHSLGMYLLASLKQDMPEHITRGYGFNEPAGDGVWGDVMERAGGRLAGDPDIYIFRPGGGFAAIAELGISRGATNFYLPTLNTGHSLSNNLWGEGSLSYYRQNPELIGEISFYTSTAEDLASQNPWEEIDHLAQTLDAAASVYGSAVQLDLAIKDGDGVEIAQSLAQYTLDQQTYYSYLATGGLPDNIGYYAHSALANGLDAVQALRGGDGWGIASETAELLRDIDDYVQANGGGSFLGKDGGDVLGGVAAALNLAAAIDGGNCWAIADSTFDLMRHYNNTPALNAAGSAVSLIVDIRNLGEALQSGTAEEKAGAAASTASSAISTYNYYAQSTYGQSAAGYLGYAAAAIQAVDGDVRGAAVNAAATYLMQTGNPYCYAAAVVLLVGNALLGGKSAPPKAHGSFGLDEHGNVVLVEVHGSSKMRDQARAFGEEMLPVLQQFQANGGRLLIDGAMPTFTLTAGEALRLKYGNEGIGKVEVVVEDNNRASLELLGVLYARDRGDRIEEAIKVSRDGFGEINMARVDALLAGQGFVKQGLTYTFGETQHGSGTSRGTGERHGGGNVGPEGQVIAAKSEHIVSLPLRADQLPSQQVGEILGAVSLRNAFTGWGNELFLMSLLSGGGVFGVAGPAFGQVEQEETNKEYIKPLDGYELSVYQRLLASGAIAAGAEGKAQTAADTDTPLPELAPGQIQQFLDAYWHKLLSAGNAFADLPASSAYYHRGLIGYGNLLADGSKAQVPPDTERWWDDWHSFNTLPGSYGGTSGESLASMGADMLHGSSFSGRALSQSQWQALQTPSASQPAPAVPPLPPAVEQGAYFITPQDSTLRFLDAALLQEAGAVHGDSSAALRLAGFGGATHGRVWQDANGDIRFEAEPGFVGTASFLYKLSNAQGEVITRRALVTVSDVNDPPNLQDDSFTLEMNSPFALSRLLENDTDPEGDSLKLDHFRGIEHGSIAYANGELVFTPEAGFTGNIAFSYWVADRPGAYPGMALAQLTYVNSQGLPNLTADRFLVLEESPLALTPERLLANDTDSTSLEVVAVEGAKHGQVSLQPDGSIVFTPAADYSGKEAGFSYTARTAHGATASAWVSIEVLNVREAPVVSAGSIEPIDAGASLLFTPELVASFVHDGDGDQLHLNYMKNVIGGSVVSENGLLRFVADKDFTGTASFDYQADDNHRGTVEGHLEFEVRPVNRPIVIGADSLSMVEDESLILSTASLLANDADPEGGEVRWHSLGAAVHGAVTQEADGSILFTPDAGYFGDAAGFNYTVVDAAGLESTGFVQVRVQGVNDAPVIKADRISIVEDEVVTFDAARLASFLSDADGDTLSLSNISAVQGGSMRFENGVYVFTPDANAYGEGRASLRFTVSDGTASVDGLLGIDISEQDDPAVFTKTELTTEEETPVAISVAELMAKVSDADGGLLFGGVGQASHGQVSWDAASGQVTFTPDADYFGDGAGFNYSVVDALGREASAFAGVQVSNVNDAPQITAASLSLKEDASLVFDQAGIAQFVQDADGDELKLSALELLEGSGSIRLEQGRYVFTPEANFNGQVALGYTISDGLADAVQGRLEVVVEAVDDPAVFGEDHFSTLEEEALTISPAELLANDNDADGALSFAGTTAAKHGSLKTDSDGNIVFTPEQDYFGADAGFTYTVRDAAGNLASSWVVVEVENVNDAPEILHDQVFLQEDQKWELNAATLAGFIRDADGDSLVVEELSAVQGGVFTEKEGLYTFIPDEHYYGKASFNYVVADGQGASVAGQMDITINPVNDVPEVALTTATMEEDGRISFAVADLLAGAHDVEDGGRLRFGGIDSSVSGDAYVDGSNSIHFLPNDDFFGQAFFRYKVLDTEGGVGYGYVQIEVNGVNDAPVAMDDAGILAWSNNLYENVYSASVLLANDLDADGDTLKLVELGSAEFGTVNLDSLGNIHYTAAAADWVGIDTFTYRISDGNGGFAEATAAIDVKINTSPDVYPEVIATREDTVSVLPQSLLLANDSDIDGDRLFITAVGQAEHCTVQLLADGSILFKPELNYNNLYPGQASFAYTVSDGISEAVNSQVFFDIQPVNDAPILTPERLYGAVEDNIFTFTPGQLLANDTDVEMASPYEEDSLTFMGVSGALNGSLVWDKASDTIFYTPNPNYNGIETFQYTVRDAQGAQSTITSEIYITPVNDRPVVEYDSGSAAEEVIWTSYKISNLLANDYDVDGDALRIINPYIIQGRGDVKITGDSLAVKPVEGSAGSRMVIGYTVTDGNGGETESRLTINEIRDHNYAPTFSGLYESGYKRHELHDGGRESGMLEFSFHAEDKNGGDTWTVGGIGMGDIMSVALSPGFSSGYYRYLFEEYDGDNYALHFDREPGSSLIFTITATDYAGATGTIVVNVNKMQTGGGIYHYNGPVVLDLNGNGVELLGLSAGVRFDWNRDGVDEQSAWVGANDALLVYDYDRNRVIDRAEEIALSEYAPGASTDLDGLRTFDSNNDRIFDRSDDEWAAFGLWQDKNSDGITDEGEFSTLSEAGIAAINLYGEKQFTEVEGNIIYETVSFTRTDGSQGLAADVALQGEELATVQAEFGSSILSRTDQADQTGAGQTGSTQTAEAVSIATSSALAVDTPELFTQGQGSSASGDVDSGAAGAAGAGQTQADALDAATVSPAQNAGNLADNASGEDNSLLSEAALNTIAAQILSDAALYSPGSSLVQDADDSSGTMPSSMEAAVVADMHSQIDAHMQNDFAIA